MKSNYSWNASKHLKMWFILIAFWSKNPPIFKRTISFSAFTNECLYEVISFHILVKKTVKFLVKSLIYKAQKIFRVVIVPHVFRNILMFVCCYPEIFQIKNILRYQFFEVATFSCYIIWTCLKTLLNFLWPSWNLLSLSYLNFNECYLYPVQNIWYTYILRSKDYFFFFYENMV